MIAGQPGLDGIEPCFEVSYPLDSRDVPTLAAQHGCHALEFRKQNHRITATLIKTFLEFYRAEKVFSFLLKKK